MGFLDTIKSWFGIGQPKVVARLDKTEVGPGALVTATIKLEGGSRPVPVTAVELYLKAETDIDSEDGSSWDELIEERVFTGGQVLEPGQSMEVTITFQVPADVEPSGASTQYEISCSADVPGWDPEHELKLTIQATPDPMSAEDFSEYHLLEEQRHFRHSSVRGDFRVIPCNEGVVLQWKDTLIARSDDGTERWRGHAGRTATISPDGTRIAASSGSKQLEIRDLDSGEVRTSFATEGYVDNIAWVDEGLALNMTEAIVIVDEEGNELRRVDTFGDDGIWCGSLTGDGTSTLFAIDSNDRLLVKLDATSGEVVQKFELNFYPSDVYLVNTAEGATVVVDSDDDIGLFSLDLAHEKTVDVPGKSGIRYLGQDEGSSTHHKVCGRLSPSGKQILANDESGMLWLMSRTGDPIRTWPRGGALDFVEDTGWLDDQRFVAITNDGRSHCVRVRDGATTWSQQDV